MTAPGSELLALADEIDNFEEIVLRSDDGPEWSDERRLTDAEKDAVATALRTASPQPVPVGVVEALVLVREIIKDGAMVGFNPLDGDWADRLFKSQGVSFAALSAPVGAGGDAPTFGCKRAGGFVDRNCMALCDCDKTMRFPTPSDPRPAVANDEGSRVVFPLTEVQQALVNSSTLVSEIPSDAAPAAVTEIDLRHWLSEQPYKASDLAQRLLAAFDIRGK